MESQLAGTRAAFAGIAVMAACACGTSSQIARLAGSYGASVSSHLIHPLFVVTGAVLFLAGAARAARAAGAWALAAAVSLLAGEKLLPVMGIAAHTQLAASQFAGIALYLAAGAFLVAALWSAFPQRERGFGLAAYAGLAASVGCNCCLITQGLAGVAHIIAPSAAWLSGNLFLYSAATVLMAAGLYRIGGLVPVLLVLTGHAINYVGLELPYANVPALVINGVALGFVTKYPMMLLGTLMMAGGFVRALAAQRGPQPVRATYTLADSSRPLIAGGD